MKDCFTRSDAVCVGGPGAPLPWLVDRFDLARDMALAEWCSNYGCDIPMPPTERWDLLHLTRAGLAVARSLNVEAQIAHIDAQQSPQSVCSG